MSMTVAQLIIFLRKEVERNPEIASYEVMFQHHRLTTGYVRNDDRKEIRLGERRDLPQ